VAPKSSNPRAKPRPPAGSALDAGLRLLARRAHSRVELRRKLQRRGHEPDEVESALSRLAELGYVDDAAFARGLVRRRSATRGPLALAAELAAKGIDRTGIADALEGIDEDSQVAAAARLAERLYAEEPLPGYREMLDRIGSKLIRRGFSSGVARAACRAVLAGASGRIGA
jgi:regulatory protein